MLLQSDLVLIVDFLFNNITPVLHLPSAIPLSFLIHFQQFHGNQVGILGLLNFHLGVSSNGRVVRPLVHLVVPAENFIMAIFKLLLSVKVHLLLKHQVMHVEIMIFFCFSIYNALVLIDLFLNRIHMLLSLLCLVVNLEDVALISNILACFLMLSRLLLGNLFLVLIDCFLFVGESDVFKCNCSSLHDPGMLIEGCKSINFKYFSLDLCC